MTLQEQREAILQVLAKFDAYGKCGDRVYFGGYIYDSLLADALCKVFETNGYNDANAWKVDATIKRLAELGYIRISKSGNRFKVLKTK
jgi:hypothetical protein